MTFQYTCGVILKRSKPSCNIICLEPMGRSRNAIQHHASCEGLPAVPATSRTQIQHLDTMLASESVCLAWQHGHGDL
jgi:hypothetical protein